MPIEGQTIREVELLELLSQADAKLASKSLAYEALLAAHEKCMAERMRLENDQSVLLTQIRRLERACKAYDDQELQEVLSRFSTSPSQSPPPTTPTPES